MSDFNTYFYGADDNRVGSHIGLLAITLRVGMTIKLHNVKESTVTDWWFNLDHDSGLDMGLHIKLA